MTNRSADLWTSDIEGSRRFYAGLFGWQAGDPSADHGGYFMFTRAGVPVAGAMGDMGEARASGQEGGAAQVRGGVRPVGQVASEAGQRSAESLIAGGKPDGG